MSLSKVQPSVPQCPDVGPSNQPKNISFPNVMLGKAKPVLRAFNASRFDKWGWLHWDESSERAFCFTCVHAFREKKHGTDMHATIAFRNHESSACHKEAVAVMITIPATHGDISECLSSVSS